MSQILYQNNNLVVTGEIGVHYDLGFEEGKLVITDEEKMDIILDFIVQVNGRMIIHKHIEHVSISKKDKSVTISNWAKWYTLVGIFFSFGYSFNDEKPNMTANPDKPLQEWIKILLQERDHLNGVYSS